MTWVAGVDGCRGGWVVVLVPKQPADHHRPHIKCCARFEEILALSPKPTVIAVDLPIGLLDEQQTGERGQIYLIKGDR